LIYKQVLIVETHHPPAIPVEGDEPLLFLLRGLACIHLPREAFDPIANSVRPQSWPRQVQLLLEFADALHQRLQLAFPDTRRLGGHQRQDPTGTHHEEKVDC
jgi:hypothetical protein